MNGGAGGPGDIGAERPWLVLVGGFLAAGKTSLVRAAARLLIAEGHRVAAILNDQGADLVDTAFVRASGVNAGEVTGGCFCCRFSDLMAAADGLAAHRPSVIFAEPVGSCTDLSATILQVLRRDHADRFRLAPLTVVVDPAQARAALAAAADPDMAFLFRNQVEEADLICFSKCDRETDFPALPSAAPVRRLSALSGWGVGAWLHEIFSGQIAPGSVTLEIDYERYAQAEAALGWLNYRVRLRLEESIRPASVVGPLFEFLQGELEAAGVRIVHLKAIDESESGYVKAAVSGCGQEPAVEGQLDASPAWEHELLVNLRAAAEPERIGEIVARVVETLPGQRSEERLECFRPAPPQPEHRVVALLGQSQLVMARVGPFELQPGKPQPPMWTVAAAPP
ncbi:MAG: GTP-binding protein [Bryobacteraceae bacterium]